MLTLFLPAAPLAADPPPAPVAAEAAATDRGFRDWRLHCAPDCRAVTDLRAADGSLLLRLEVPAGSELVRIATPLPLHLPEGVSLAAGGAEAWQVPWRTCGAGECLAEVRLAPDLWAALRRERAATVELTLVEGLRVRLAVSLLGFSAAERALSRP